VNETGSIPFFTSANSSRSWGAFLRAEERLAEGGGRGAMRGAGRGSAWVGAVVKVVRQWGTPNT
jgi:hypothetical protein